ncbi:MAG TPA: drug/metabolite exporter YedA [Ramlibacter sp.]|jgi:drug/metabolite transporter (DMT)-like permease|uniref:drug/metabolite exporter YedA n=1 Tax=Ramlibacter sp. TaxID=1917967 RepID=UPI002D3FA981|nr:drug/metabolite exporter YedA [Ramlibacter sp.]HZY19318.1 drug/metabolite exporter YedA [Ramlibacter sp.]
MDARQPAFSRRRTDLVVPALLACYLVWGSTYLAIRLALASFPPFFQMGTRFLAAGALLLTWTLLRGGTWPGRRHWRNAAIVGTLMLGAGMGLTASAEQHVGSGLVAAFIAVVPILVCLWGLLVGERPGRLELAGMLVGLGGVLLLVQGASFAAAPGALACMAGATLAWSLGSVLSATRLPLAPGAAGFASEMLCGGAALMLVSLVLGEQPQWPPSRAASLAWLYLVGAGSLVAFSAYLYLLGHASPAVATSYAFVNPVIALLLGVGFGGERVSLAEWAACAVVLLGVVLILRGKTGPRRASRQAPNHPEKNNTPQ